MATKIRREIFDQVIAHAEVSYPEECCGLLVARSDNSDEVIETVKMKNSYPGPRHDRYSIDPMEFYKADDRVAQQGNSVIGIYHSHPEHPSVPSAYDKEYALPGLHYVVVSVSGGKFRDAKSWTLNDDRTTFSDEPIQVITAL